MCTKREAGFLIYKSVTQFLNKVRGLQNNPPILLAQTEHYLLQFNIPNIQKNTKLL